MLIETGRSGRTSRIAVLTRNETVTRLLRAILVEWNFILASGTDPADILLIERGLVPPGNTANQLIWLSPMPLGAEPHLELPLSLVELYHYLEQLYFSVPRRHIRLLVNEPMDVNVHGVWLVGSLVSISDRGARISCPATLPRGTEITLDFKLGGYPLRLEAEVLYEIPAGDFAGRENPQAGLLFRPPRPALRLALRSYIEKSYVERACAAEGIAPGDASLSWFDLVDNPWEGLQS